MLPDATASAGYCELRITWDPNQNTKTTTKTTTIVIIVWKYSFFHSLLGVDVANG
jgi:hypothetical protein